MWKYLIILFIATNIYAQERFLSLMDDVTTAPTTRDSIPAQFTFTDITDAALSSYNTSNGVTLTGLDSAWAYAAGDSFKVNAGALRVAGIWVYLNDVIYLTKVASASNSTAVSSTLTVGGVSDTYSVTTTAIDTIPSAFTFTDITNASLSTVYTSNGVALTGFDSAYAYGGGAEFRIGALGSWITAYTMVDNNDTLYIRKTSSASYSTAVTGTLTVGGTSDVYSVTTRAIIYDSSITTPLASSDDGYYRPVYVDIATTANYIGYAVSTTNSSAVRFRNVNIPSGATIDSARVYVYAANNYTGTTTAFRIYGEDVDSINVFRGDDSGADFNTRDNTLTTNYTSITSEVDYSVGVIYTYVVTTVISELVATRNYTYEALALFFIDQSSTSYRRYRTYDYDGSTNLPTLKIYYHY